MTLVVQYWIRSAWSFPSPFFLSMEKLSCCPDLCPRVSYGGAGHKYNNSDLTRILHKRGDNKSQSSIAGNTSRERR